MTTMSCRPSAAAAFRAINTGAHYAVMAVLTALLYREGSGAGQFIDVSQHAAANITTEMATYSWLVEQSTVQRQTGRHAMTVTFGANPGPDRGRPLREYGRAAAHAAGVQRPAGLGG